MASPHCFNPVEQQIGHFSLCQQGHIFYLTVFVDYLDKIGIRFKPCIFPRDVVGNNHIEVFRLQFLLRMGQKIFSFSGKSDQNATGRKLFRSQLGEDVRILHQFQG